MASASNISIDREDEVSDAAIDVTVFEKMILTVFLFQIKQEFLNVG
jgi:hypothetical protein